MVETLLTARTLYRHTQNMTLSAGTGLDLWTSASIDGVHAALADAYKCEGTTNSSVISESCPLQGLGHGFQTTDYFFRSPGINWCNSAAYQFPQRATQPVGRQPQRSLKAGNLSMAFC